MCSFGMIVETPSGPGLGRKDTAFLANSYEIARCTGDRAHASLLNGVAKQAQRYPVKLCQAICRGSVKQKHRIN